MYYLSNLFIKIFAKVQKVVKMVRENYKIIVLLFFVQHNK